MNLYLLTAYHGFVPSRSKYVIMAESAAVAIRKWVDNHPEYNEENSVEEISLILKGADNHYYFIK